MAAETIATKQAPGALASDERGQSIIEFLLMLPMMLGLVVILVKVNTTIQMSIVNQQYARAQALWLTFNSPDYPQLTLQQSSMIKQSYNQMVIGVSENQATGDGESYSPKAATHYIARKRGIKDSDDAVSKSRALVRIHDTVTLCTQPVVVQGQAGFQPLLPLKPMGASFTASGIYNLGETSRFNYCSAPMTYSQGPDGGAI